MLSTRWRQAAAVGAVAVGVFAAYKLLRARSAQSAGPADKDRRRREQFKQEEEALEMVSTPARRRDPVDEMALLSLESEFEEAAQYVNARGGSMSQEQKLRFYALFKQATVGKNDRVAPSMLNARAYAKWSAWREMGDMSKDDAIALYVEELEKVAPSWRDDDASLVDGAQDSQESGTAEDGLAFNSVSRFSYDEGDVSSDEEDASKRDVFGHAKHMQTDLVLQALRSNPALAHELRPDTGTLLHVAADTGNLELASALLSEFGADPNVQDDHNYTPLLSACVCEHAQIVRVLCQHGADPNICDEDDESPLTCCNDECRSILEAALAKRGTT